MTEKYLKIGLYTIGTLLVLWIMYIIYNLFKKAKGAGKTVADAVNNKAENKRLATIFSITENEVSEARGMAHDLSIELETNNQNEHGWLWNANHISDSEKVVDILRPITTQNQLQCVATIYKNEYTDGNSLYKDLNTGTKAYYVNWFPSDIKKIKFLSTITNI